MKILWENGALKPNDIQKKMPLPVKNSALRWQLAALVERGELKRERRGKAYYYRAVLEREEALESLISQMAHVFSGGSALALIAEIIDSQKDRTEEKQEVSQNLIEDKPRAPIITNNSEDWKSW